MKREGAAGPLSMAHNVNARRKLHGLLGAASAFLSAPTQLPWILEKICEESYRPLLAVLAKHPGARATVNINAVLTEMLRDHGHGDVIQSLADLARKGQIEFTGSGKYHPILPLIPLDEARRQIDLNRRSNSYFLGDVYKPVGFFPPEMAYGSNIVSPICDTGHRWVILSGVATPIGWPTASVPYIACGQNKLKVFFRDDVWSNKISFHDVGPNEFLEHLRSLSGAKEKQFVVTAMDAETYGHHIQNWEERFLAEVYQKLEVKTDGEVMQRKVLASQETNLLQAVTEKEDIRTVTISQLMDLFPEGERIEPKASSWSTTEGDIEAGNPYPLWQDKGSQLHGLQWEHIDMALQLCLAAQRMADNDRSRHFAGIARGLMDMALHSCQFWWGSNRHMWDINLVHMGLLEQWRVILNAYRSISTSGTSPAAKRTHYYLVVLSRDIRNRIDDLLFMDR